MDTAVDAGGNFWDAHDAVYCRNLLVRLQHPAIALSTINLTIASGYGLCGASSTGVVMKFEGGPQDATHQAFANGQNGVSLPINVRSLDEVTDTPGTWRLPARACQIPLLTFGILAGVRRGPINHRFHSSQIQNKESSPCLFFIPVVP